jgi:hypothetical protein
MVIAREITLGNLCIDTDDTMRSLYCYLLCVINYKHDGYANVEDIPDKHNSLGIHAAGNGTTN